MMIPILDYLGLDKPAIWWLAAFLQHFVHQAIEAARSLPSSMIFQLCFTKALLCLLWDWEKWGWYKCWGFHRLHHPSSWVAKWSVDSIPFSRNSLAPRRPSNVTANSTDTDKVPQKTSCWTCWPQSTTSHRVEAPDAAFPWPVEKWTDCINEKIVSILKHRVDFSFQSISVRCPNTRCSYDMMRSSAATTKSKSSDGISKMADWKGMLAGQF